MCTSKVPFVKDDTLYAYVAGPGLLAKTDCGKCYQMDLSNAQGDVKKAVVKVNNFGYDVADDQFDLAVPGGGFGNFAGCSYMAGWELSPTCNPEKDTPKCKVNGGLTDSMYCAVVFPGDSAARKACENVLWGVFPPKDSAGYPAQLQGTNRKEVACPALLP